MLGRSEKKRILKQARLIMQFAPGRELRSGKYPSTVGDIRCSDVPEQYVSFLVRSEALSLFVAWLCCVLG